MDIKVNGKQFEDKFKKDWLRTFPKGDVQRLYDVQFGYKSISNVSDFICYNYPLMFYIDCKAHKGASIPFDAITQYDKLLDKSGIKGVRAGIILYLYEKGRVFYIPVSTIKSLKDDGKKSVGIKAFEEGYRIIEIPSKMLKSYMDSDYSCLMELEENE